jgi:hypothetical protein
MKGFSLLLLAGTALFVAVAPASSRIDSQRANAAACGNATVGGATVVTYCGPAKASVKLGAKTYRISGGRCSVSAGHWVLLIGRQTLPPAKAKFLSFQAVAKLAKTKAGTYKKGEFTLSFQMPGKDYVISAGNPYMPTGSVTITARARRGTFVGVNALKTKQHITGSWSC